MTNDSLIEKLQAKMQPGEYPRERAYNKGVSDAIGVINQHTEARGDVVAMLQEAHEINNRRSCDDSILLRRVLHRIQAIIGDASTRKDEGYCDDAKQVGSSLSPSEISDITAFEAWVREYSHMFSSNTVHNHGHSESYRMWKAAHTGDALSVRTGEQTGRVPCVSTQSPSRQEELEDIERLFPSVSSVVDDEGAVQIILQYIDSSEGTEEELQYCARELLHKLLEYSSATKPVFSVDAELMEEYERAKEEAVETCQGAMNSYGCGYDSGYREGIRWAIYRGEADGK